MKSKMTIVAFALSLGNNDRLTLEQSAPLHMAYKKAKDEDKAATRLDFIVSYLQGNLSVGKAIATKIAEKERDSRTTVQQQSYDRARSKFGYHIERAKPGSGESDKRNVWSGVAKQITAINSYRNKLSAENRKTLRDKLVTIAACAESHAEKATA